SVSGPVGPGRGCGPGVVTAYTLADAESHIRQPGPQALIADRDRLRPVAPGESDDRTREFETTQPVRGGLQMEVAVRDRALELHRGLDAAGVGGRRECRKVVRQVGRPTPGWCGQEVI